ncbi:phage tail protein [Pseudomonas putida]|uniref:Phage tail protein n=1 Tax=Pseudomonas putida TaxID=303 RepID=A0A4D6XFD6_PSEPU|nr:phage tail assembly chaperone [Pseudomonas putida]QCI14244.1 phage tail protein [Pseudomonas putida]
MRFYSPSTACCYLTGIHEEMPSDAQPISEEIYQSVIANPERGKVRSHDSAGQPNLIDPPLYEPTLEDLKAGERTWRDSYLTATEWLVTRYRDEKDMQRAPTLTIEQFNELLVYRQALRDWPQSESFPDSACRPVEPTWLPTQFQ